MAIGELPPLSLYVHIPWCVRKCPYCDFNSHVAADTLPEADYIDALLGDLAEDASLAQGRKPQSIFIGGGTPSLFSDRAIGKLLAGIDATLGLEDCTEITMEANPGAVDEAHFHGYRAAGVNRLSIGVQSFSEDFLHTLGRIHTPNDARHAFDTARRAGFDNINIDLMYGLPEQSPEQARSDLEQGIALQPEHLSWYELTLEPNTAFYSQPPSLPGEGPILTIEKAGHALLAKNNYQRYEVSAYAQAQRRSRHNLNYWQFGDYLALGAGAHGKATLLESGEVIRFWKTRTPADYLGKAGNRNARRQVISAADMPFEFMMNALRLVDGVDEKLFARRTGIELATLAKVRRRLVEQGLLEAGPRLRTSARGGALLNSVLQAFIDEDLILKH